MKKSKLLGIKKSQISLFVIIAIALVVIIAILIFARNFSIDNTDKVDPQVEPIYSFVKDCIEDSAIQSIEIMGLTGGDYKSDLKTEGSVAYYFYDGSNHVPSREKLEEELNDLVSEFTKLCISNLSQFSDYKVNFGRIDVKSQINEDNVVINADYPISISKGNKNYQIKSFKDIVIENRIGYLLNIAGEIIKGLEKNPSGLCLNCLYDIQKKYEIYLSVHDLDEENSIIILTDPKSKINNENYAFLFAVKIKTRPFNINDRITG